MSFFKKLFGISDTKEQQNNAELEENVVELGEETVESEDEGNSDQIEVIVNEISDEETVELLNDEKKEEKTQEHNSEKKSIKEIVDEVNEFIVKNEQATLECNEPKIEHISELSENIGIIKKEVVVEHTYNPFIKNEIIVLEEEVKEVAEETVTEEESNEDCIEDRIEDSTEDTKIHEKETVANLTETEITQLETEVIETENLEEVSKQDVREITEEMVSELSDEVNEGELSADELSQDEELENDTEKEASKKSFFAKLKEGVKKTRDSIFGNLNAVFNMFTTVDEELFEELEEALILADMGVDTSLYIINELRKQVKRKGITEVHEVKDALVEIISNILSKDDNELVIKPQTVILVIGVNGAGKTTTIGKLTHNLMSEGHSVTVAAADTFRAAAIEQLQVWAERSNAHFIRKEEGSDPASVVFDACQSAKSRGTDVLIIDTAGRLQNKKNLMEELKKINRIIDREFESANKEVFLVLDSTTGQNAMQQAKLFNETADITGLILTKLDGTAKGGVIVSIKNELNVPVRYVGLGEKIDDLERFDSKQFAKAMFE